MDCNHRVLIILQDVVLVIPASNQLRSGSNYRQFHDDLQDAHFSANTVITIIDACHSAIFIDGGCGDDYIPKSIPQGVTVLTACKSDEDADTSGIIDLTTLSSYEPSWSLSKKINYCQPYFTRAFLRGAYLGYNMHLIWDSLANNDYFESSSKDCIYGYIFHNKQHPVRSEYTFDYQTFYLYIV